VDVPLGRRSLELMIKAVIDDRAGLLVVDLPDGRTARLERTDAVNRARLLAGPGEDLADVIERTHGVRRGVAAEFWPPGTSEKPKAGATKRSAAGPVTDRQATETPEDRHGHGRSGLGPAGKKLVKRLRTALRGD
jgi:hypothetical protein